MANLDIWIIIVLNNLDKELEDLLKEQSDAITVIKKGTYLEIAQIKMDKVDKDQTNEKNRWLN